jgi:hypothetical protein
MRRSEASRSVSAGAARRAEAPDMVQGVLRRLRARVLPEESRGTEGETLAQCRGHPRRESPPHHRVPRGSSVRGLRGDRHHRARVRPSRRQSRRSVNLRKRRTYLGSNRSGDCEVRGPVRQLPSAKDESDALPVVITSRALAQSNLSTIVAGSAYVGGGPRAASLPSVRRDETCDRIPVSIDRSPTRQRICLSCQRTYAKDWYQRNKEKQISAARIRRDREAKNLGRTIREYLQDYPCVDCGESDPTVLDFDHLRDKRADVSSLVHGAASWDLVLAEVAKCEVRCANCHRRRTAHVGGHYRAIEARIRNGTMTR